MDTMVNRGPFHEESMEYLENNDRGLVVLDAKRRLIDNIGRQEDISDSQITKRSKKYGQKTRWRPVTVSGTHQEI